MDVIAVKPIIKKQDSLLSSLILFTCLATFAQISFQLAHLLILFNGFDTPHLIANLAFNISLWHIKIIFFPLLFYVAVQCAIASIYVLLIWYLAISIGELFNLRWSWIYCLGLFLWLDGALAILTANTYYLHHSFFTDFIRHTLFNNVLTDKELYFALVSSLALLFIAAICALFNLCMQLYKNQNKWRHGVVLTFLLLIVISLSHKTFLSQPKTITDSVLEQPNIIIIGLDALRPDCVDTTNQCGINAPHINHFLQSTIKFTDAYAPLSKTAPSWAAMLTAKYPKHNNSRDNNSDLRYVKLDETLAKSLKQQGYQTIYATDDRRYNNVNESFGFDKIIGPPGGLNDFLIGTVNDFPLSNLLVMTALGEWLFPYNFGNHSVSVTYNPNDFLQLISEGLRQRTQKPLFLAVHFNVSGFPFLVYNDNQTDSFDFSLSNYKNAAEIVDDQFGKFYTLLEKNNLLKHAIVVVISDHGITLGFHGDRVIAKSFYQGNNKENLKKIFSAKYIDAARNSMDFKRDYGIDTSYGYGGDVLSLKQNHAILAFKAYGMNIGNPRTVAQRASLLDIGPTLLDILQLPPLLHSDGVSLKKYFMSVDHPAFFPERAFYLETAGVISNPDAESEKISPNDYLVKVEKLLNVNPESGQLFLDYNKMHKQQGLSKEHAIVQGAWMLAQHPPFSVLTLIPDTEGQQDHKQNSAQNVKLKISSKLMPGYLVLVNLKTQQWTMEWTTSFAKHAPLKKLFEELHTFYGDELGDVALSSKPLVVTPA